ncbi:hypothetical protein JCM10213_002596 [Rhodosporidiobolus nylandii]
MTKETTAILQPDPLATALRALPDPSKPAYPLPAELTLRVLKETEDWRAKDATKALAACCLVSKTFLDLARPLLYLVVILSGADVSEDTPLVLSLQAGNAAHVRKLVLKSQPVKRDFVWGGARPHKTERMTPEVLSLLQSMVDLERLVLTLELDHNDTYSIIKTCFPCWTNLSGLQMPAQSLELKYLRCLPNLKHLALADVSVSKEDRAAGSPSFELEQLELFWYSWGMKPADFAFLTSTSTSSLTALVISPTVPADTPNLSSFPHLRSIEFWMLEHEQASPWDPEDDGSFDHGRRARPT